MAALTARKHIETSNVDEKGMVAFIEACRRVGTHKSIDGVVA